MSDSGTPPIGRLFFLAVLAGIAALVFSERAELRRYMQIRAM